MNKYTNKNIKGFTLLETLVAILLFTIALAALLALVRDSVTAASYMKNEVVGTYLAQEGIDYIRNKRDEIVHVNPVPPSPWSDFLNYVNNAGCSNTTGCKLDVYATTQLEACLPPSCQPFIVSWRPFRRTITTQSIGTTALLVRVDVSWNNGVTTRTKTLTTSLYNWSL